MHCASLVHDDMPCFDDADTRRGQVTVHKLYGEPLALLTGDALIVMAYQTLAHAGASHPERLAALLMTLCEGTGAPNGIVAGQAWECEPRVQLGQYQRAKTGALFVAATAGGALAAGADPKPWVALGEWLGEAYQVADDIRDVMADPSLLGKPVGQDIALGRPSSAIDLGLGGAIAYFEKLVQSAIDSVPECTSREAMRQLVRLESERLVPREACDKRCCLMRTLDLAKPLDGGHNRPAWRDRLDAWMDRKLTDPGFSRWAAANVLTRWITRRRAQQVFDVMA
eukprot:gene51154-68479_t